MSVAVPDDENLTELDRRRIAFEDALCLALEARGHLVEDAADYKWDITCLIHGERIDLRFYEPDRRKRAPLTRKEWGYRADGSATKQVLEPSGTLTLVARPDRFGGGERRWSNVTGKITDREVGRIVARLESIAALITQGRIRHEEWEAEYEEWKRRVAERLRRERELEKRVDILDGLAGDWRHAKRLRAFLAVAEAQLLSHPDPEGLGRWLEWARAHAESIDPLSGENLPHLPVLASSDGEEDLGEPDECEKELRALGLLDASL